MLQQSWQPGNDSSLHEPFLCAPGLHGGSPLPERLLRALEHLSGHDLGGVRVHRDSALPAGLGARAFAYGEDIHLSPGAEDALAHEAWHVVQQREGRVRPTGRLGGFPLNDDPWLECEAEVMGRRAERLSASPTPGGIRRVPVLTGPVAHPVVQRVVTVGADVLLTARAIRDKLNIWHGVTANNTPHLQQIVDDIVRKKRTFTNLAALKDEVKRRSFGLRHREAMEALHDRQEQLKDDYMRANHISTRAALANIAEKFRRAGHSARLASLHRKYPPFPFLHWGPATNINPVKINRLVLESQVFRWLTSQNVTPVQLNCWETVLYGGAWTYGGRRALFSKQYAFWADQARQIKATTIPQEQDKPDAAKPTGRNRDKLATIMVPRFVSDIIDNPVAHQTNKGQAGGVPRIPDTIHPGMIVVFNCGQHVALATGRRREMTTAKAIAFYGTTSGHEMLEVDGATCGLVPGTFEDAFFQVYGRELHLGWLPECHIEETLTYDDVTVQVAPTSFYA